MSVRIIDRCDLDETTTANDDYSSEAIDAMNKLLAPLLDGFSGGMRRRKRKRSVSPVWEQGKHQTTGEYTSYSQSG